MEDSIGSERRGEKRTLEVCPWDLSWGWGHVVEENLSGSNHPFWLAVVYYVLVKTMRYHWVGLWGIGSVEM